MATIERYETSTGARRYQVRYRTPQRTQTKKRGFTTKRDAEAFAATVEVEKMTGSYVAPKLGQVTVGDLGPAWLTRQAHHKLSWSARLESVWRVHVEPRWGAERIADIRRSDVQAWVAGLPLSPSSVAHCMTVLSGVLDAAVADRRLVENPAKGVRLPRKVHREKRFLSAAQISTLATESSRPEIVWLLATTGLRWGELAALRVRDVDVERRRVRIERSASKVNAETVIGTTKTHQARSVAVPVSVLDLLLPITEGKGLDDLLWTRENGQPLRPPTTTHWFNRAVQRCQAADETFPRVTVHELRHTAASLMIRSGANVKTVQSQLGHKTATMTLDQYGHLFPDDLDDIAGRMESVVSGCAQNVPTAPILRVV